MGRSVRSWENPARRERALHGEIEVWTELGGGGAEESQSGGAWTWAASTSCEGA